MTPRRYLAVVSAGLLLGVSTVGLAACGDDDSNRDTTYNGGGSTFTIDTNDAKCALASYGVQTIATALNRGKKTLSIRAAGFLTGRACKQAYETYADDPSVLLEVDIETPNGVTVSSPLTGNRLMQAVTAPPPPSGAERTIACFGWDNEPARRLCYDGYLDPP